MIRYRLGIQQQTIEREEYGTQPHAKLFSQNEGDNVLDLIRYSTTSNSLKIACVGSDSNWTLAMGHEELILGRIRIAEKYNIDDDVRHTVRLPHSQVWESTMLLPAHQSHGLEYTQKKCHLTALYESLLNDRRESRTPVSIR